MTHWIWMHLQWSLWKIKQSHAVVVGVCIYALNSRDNLVCKRVNLISRNAHNRFKMWWTIYMSQQSQRADFPTKIKYMLRIGRARKSENRVVWNRNCHLIAIINTICLFIYAHWLNKHMVFKHAHTPDLDTFPS